MASALFGGLMLFFLGLFAGFGQARYGLMIDLGIAPILIWIWVGHLRLRRVLAAYRDEEVGPTP